MVFFNAALYRAMGEPKYVVAGQKDSGELAFRAAETRDDFYLPVRKNGTSRYVKIYGIEFYNANAMNRYPTMQDGEWWYLIGIKIK